MTRVRGDYQMDFEKLSIPLTSFYSCFNASDGADVVRFKLRVHNCQTSTEFHPAESWKRVPSRRFTTVAANINGNRKTKVSRHADILTYLEGAWPLSVQVTRVTQTLATITKLSYDQRTDTVQSYAKISFLHSLLLTVWLFVYWYNFWPLCRECNKTNFHRCPPIEQMDELPVSDPCVWTKICGIATRQTLRIPREKCRAKGCFDAKKANLERVQLFFGAHCNTTEGPRSKGANCSARANEFCSARSAPLGSFQLSTGRSAPFLQYFLERD